MPPHLLRPLRPRRLLPLLPRTFFLSRPYATVDSSATDIDVHIQAKYAAKLDAKAKQQGLADARALRAEFHAHLARLRQKKKDAAAASPSAAARPPPPAPSAPHAPGTYALSTLLPPETLSLPLADLEAAWRARLAPVPNSLCACVPAAVYTRMAGRARRWPAFILPLPASLSSSSAGEEEASLHFVQWTFPPAAAPIVLVTHLAEYKLRGEHAAPHTVLAMHLDLMESRGVVLLEGGVKGAVSVGEGQWFASVLPRVWGEEGEGGEGERLLAEFTAGEDAFTLERLVRLVGRV